MKPSEELKQLWLLQDTTALLLRRLRKADKEVLNLSVELAKNLQTELVAFLEHVTELVAKDRDDYEVNGL